MSINSRHIQYIRASVILGGVIVGFSLGWYLYAIQQTSLRIKSRRVVAQLETGNTFTLLAEDTTVVAIVNKPANVPIIAYYQALPSHAFSIHQKAVIPDIAATIYYIDSMQERQVFVNEVAVESPHMIRLHTEKGMFIFSDTAIEGQQKKLSYFLQHNTHAYNEADFRFHDIILR